MSLRLSLQPLLALCQPPSSPAAVPTDSGPAQRLVLAGSTWDDAAVALEIIPSAPWPHDLAAWRQRLLSRELPAGLILAPLRHESLRTPSGWDVTVVLAALCHDPAQVSSYRQERIGYFFSLLDTVAAMVLYVRDRAAYGRFVPALQQVLRSADLDWDRLGHEPATLSQLWAQPPAVEPQPGDAAQTQASPTSAS